jgi:hypothetical protein
MITDTSRAAHEYIKPLKPSLRERVFAYILAQGFAGATIAEIAAATGIKESSVCGRVNELHDPDDRKPRICNSGRKPDSGNDAIVWWAFVDPVQTTLFNLRTP